MVELFGIIIAAYGAWQAFHWFRYRWVVYKQEHALKQWTRGYDWACGAIVRGEMSPMEIDAYTSNPDRNEFDTGADQAVDFLVTAGFVRDDRI